MAFSEAQFHAAADKINSGMSDLSGKIGQIRPTAESAVRPPFARCGTTSPRPCIPDDLVASLRGRFVLDTLSMSLAGSLAVTIFAGRRRRGAPG